MVLVNFAIAVPSAAQLPQTSRAWLTCAICGVVDPNRRTGHIQTRTLSRTPAKGRKRKLPGRRNDHPGQFGSPREREQLG